MTDEPPALIRHLIIGIRDRLGLLLGHSELLSLQGAQVVQRIAGRSVEVFILASWVQQKMRGSAATSLDLLHGTACSGLRDVGVL